MAGKVFLEILYVHEKGKVGAGEFLLIMITLVIKFF